MVLNIYRRGSRIQRDPFPDAGRHCHVEAHQTSAFNDHNRDCRGWRPDNYFS